MPNKVFSYILGIDHKYTGHEIHNISALYKVCRSKEKCDTYNDVKIDDILVDAENVEKYAKGIKGYRIVETSASHKVEGEYALIMEYPADKSSSSRVKIIFEDKRVFWRQYYKLTEANRTKPIVIAGDWELTPNEKDYKSQCIIHRAKQIYYVGE